MLRSLTLAANGGCLAPRPRRADAKAAADTHPRRRPLPRPSQQRLSANAAAAAATSSSSSSSAAAAASAAAPGSQQLGLPRLAALDRPQSLVLVAARAQPLQRLAWRVGDDDCALEVWYRPPWRPSSAAAAAASSAQAGAMMTTTAMGDDAATTIATATIATVRPPVLLVHGLFRAAWSWEESFLPALSASGRASYAVSLRGQGGSELAGGRDDRDRGVAAAVEEAGGVPMDVIMADLEAVVARVAEHHAEEARRWRQWEQGAGIGGEGVPSAQADDHLDASAHAPVLVGHSLGGMFVQEYLARLHMTQEEQQGAAAASAAAPATKRRPHPPPIRGAALLASATAGTVMDFARFASDVGLPEFLWQMWIVATGQHLRDLSVARYCWWPDEEGQGGEAGEGGEGGSSGSGGFGGVPAEQARRWHALVVGSSRACPYVRGEVTRWNPPPRPQQQQKQEEDAGAVAAAAAAAPPPPPPPPVLALGGARDRIIRPWQVAAAREHWGADVVMLPGLTHDVMLGPGAERALAALVSWLEQRVEGGMGVVGGGAAGGGGGR